MKGKNYIQKGGYEKEFREHWGRKWRESFLNNMSKEKKETWDKMLKETGEQIKKSFLKDKDE